ncbi:MAG: hypothetical protein HYW25_01690 [Candidatus Aenigmarchaeota archaeon]|nr:hypothetical protein [Candidatus Aenigmarchaeota archaeon]
MKGIYIAVVVFAIVVVGAVLAISAAPSEGIRLPYYATSQPMTKEAYMFAVENPEQLNGINCYCGCMQHSHSGRIHSRGLLDCFMKEDGSFEKHASECDMCLNDALAVKQMSLDGVQKDEIKAAIDDKYR